MVGLRNENESEIRFNQQYFGGNAVKIGKVLAAWVFSNTDH